MIELLLTSSQVAQHMVVLLVVVIIKVILNTFSPTYKQQTFYALFQLYCERLADKVNKDGNSKTQRKIAGFIATLITFFPIILIVWLFGAFIEVPLLWQGLLLFFAFGRFNINYIGRAITKDLLANDNDQAKQKLAPWLARECTNLSSIGLTKASIEMILLKKLQQQFVIGCFFIVIGPVAALAYRLLLEMHYSWHIKRNKFHAFGLFIHTLVNILQWLPSRFFLLLLMLTSIQQSHWLYWRLLNKHFFEKSNNIVIGYFAYTLGVTLGGVAMYEKQKLRKVSFNNKAPQPEPNHIIDAIKQINLVITLALGLVFSIIILLIFLTNK